MSEKKLMIGPKVRRLRKDQRLTQAQMAADLDISPAYLNLIEHNQRPVSAQVLVKLAATYDIDLGVFAKDDSEETAQTLRTLFADPALGDLTLSAQDYRDLATLSPEAISAIQTLGERVAGQRELLQSGVQAGALIHLEDAASQARNFFQARENYFPELEELAEQIRSDLNLRPQDRGRAIEDALVSHAPYSMQIMPASVMGSTLRRLDVHGRRLLLNEALSASSRRFQLAVQYFITQHGLVLDRLLKSHDWSDPSGAKLARTGLASYAASAMLMPYNATLSAAREQFYDVDSLAHSFAVSREQMAHRLTTLHRPGGKGVPFFLARLDAAGQITKRLSAAGFPVIEAGAACPRWHVHEFLSQGDRIRAELVELPEGKRFLSVAIPCRKPDLSFDEPGQSYVLVIGCAAEQAHKTIYGRGLDVSKASATPIGPACRLCERLTCTFRAAPPANHEIQVDETRRDMMPFAFR